MSNFKSGSGNLDFGDDDETSESQTADEAVSTASDQESRKSGTDQTSTEGLDESPGNATSSPSADQFPYFVRRSNVGDERDTRLEIHVRDKVADREGAFRNELAEQLDVNEISKTDAREFALLAAFQNPERVAELMEDEGFGAVG